MTVGFATAGGTDDRRALIDRVRHGESIAIEDRGVPVVRLELMASRLVKLWDSPAVRTIRARLPGCVGPLVVEDVELLIRPALHRIGLTFMSDDRGGATSREWSTCAGAGR